MISDISFLSLAEADMAQCRDPVEDGGHDTDRQMDFDEERDFADQDPLTDMDMEEECLDVHLLKPSRLDVIPGQPDVVCADDAQQGPAQAWLQYPFSQSHPILRWLPSKLAARIGENFGQELSISPKRR